MHRFIFITSVFLSGCVMLPAEYYAPISEVGEARGTVCYGGIGPKESLRIQLDAVDISFSIQKIENIEKSDVQEFVRRHGELKIGEAKSSYSMHVHLSIPEENSVLWTQPTVEFESESGESVIGFISHFSNSRVESNKVVFENTSINTKLVGSSKKFRKYTYHKRYNGEILLGPDGFNKIKLKSIKLKVNNETKIIKNIDFTKKSGWFSYPLNC